MGLLHKMDNWVDVSTYAKACGVTNRTIVERMERGVLSYAVIDGTRIIDSAATPPVKRTHGSDKKVSPLQWPEFLPPVTELVWVWRFAKEKGIRADAIYRAVIHAEIDAWGVAGRVLVRRSDVQGLLQRNH